MDHGQELGPCQLLPRTGPQKNSKFMELFFRNVQKCLFCEDNKKGKARWDEFAAVNHRILKHYN